MMQILGVLAPIFGLIGLGWIADGMGWLGDGAVDVLNRYVLRFALPAELFHLTTRLSLADLDHPGFAIAFGGGMMATALLAGLWGWRRPVDGRHRLSGAAIEGLSAAYANTAFIGIPICLAVFGPAASAAITLSSLLVVCVLFAAGILSIEFENEAAGTAGGAWRPLRKVARTLACNPILFAPVAGLVLNLAAPAFGWVPRSGVAAADTAIDLLAGSATPCALVTIGLFLAGSRGEPAPWTAVLRVTALKLFGQPAITFAFAALLSLPAAWTREAVVLAALPTGTGPFMLARLYRREGAVAGRVTLLSTLLSMLTLALLLWWSGGTDHSDR